MTNPTFDFVTSYYEAWTSRDVEAILACFTADAVFEDLAFAARFEGHEQIRSFVELTFAGAPDFVVRPTQIVCEPTQAAASWVMTGTHAGDFPGLPATNKPFQVRASSIITLEDGKISQIVDYWNPIEFQQSVGLV